MSALARSDGLSIIPLIAVVDDDAHIREALDDLLQVEGDSVRTFASGPRLLAALSDCRFDLVLTDLRMPGMDGMELLQKLRGLDPGLPAIVLTSSSTSETCERSLREGAIACLAKPVNAEQLLRLIGATLGEPGSP
jgi:DNA-binding NtrC family response regulator